jgi:hypothetical protein
MHVCMCMCMYVCTFLRFILLCALFAVILFSLASLDTTHHTKQNTTHNTWQRTTTHHNITQHNTTQHNTTQLEVARVEHLEHESAQTRIHTLTDTLMHTQTQTHTLNTRVNDLSVRIEQLIDEVQMHAFDNYDDMLAYEYVWKLVHLSCTLTNIYNMHMLHLTSLVIICVQTCIHAGKCIFAHISDFNVHVCVNIRACEFVSFIHVDVCLWQRDELKKQLQQHTVDMSAHIPSGLHEGVNLDVCECMFVCLC